MSFIREGLRVDDFLVEERQPQFSRTFAVVKNPHMSPVNLSKSIARFLRKNGNDWELLVKGQEANASGVILSNKPINLAAGASSTEVFVILEKGPVILNADKLVTTDALGDELDFAAVKAALETKNFKFVTEPPHIETQTT